MHLKRLEIQGFKSFANKTVLDFLPPKDGHFTITAIVGPNGAGKSNVTDAIRWAMGERSMKALRGEKSEDIIFNGSESKGAMSAAEVTMTLDNSDNPVGLDFPEITVTRRIFRSGEGEYLINNNPSRLLELQLLFAKAQFAEHAYSIVSQGMIDRLLIVSPAERKDFFDEAVGIKEFQIKQHQAELKLTHTQENMQQAKALIQEVEPRLKILARQVKKLERRQTVEKELVFLQEKFYTTLYLKNKKELDGVNDELVEVEKKYRAAFSELEAIQTELATLAGAASRQEVFDKLRGSYQAAINERSDLERRLAIITGQMQAEYREIGQQNVGWLENKIFELKNTQEKLAAEFKEAGAEAERMNNLVAEQNKLLDNLGAKRAQLLLKISRLESQLIKERTDQSYYQFSGLTAVKAVLETRNRFGVIYGIVAELSEVAEEYQLALEVAAGQYLSSIIVEDEGVARLAIEYLRNHHYGVATFLPLTKIQSREPSREDEELMKQPGVIGLATDLIKCDGKFQNIFSLIFRNTIVVKDLATAERVGMGRIRMVTLDGDLIEKSGAMKGGFRQTKGSLNFSSKLSLFGGDHLDEFQASIALEQNNLSELDQTLEKAKAKFLELQVGSQSAVAKAEIAALQNKKIEEELAAVNQELHILKIKPEEYGEELSRLAREKDLLTKKIGEDGEAIKKFTVQIEDFNRREEEKKQRVFALQEEIRLKQNAVNDILSYRSEFKIQAAKMETKQEGLAQEVMNDMNISLSSILERNPEIADISELEAMANQIQKLKYQLSLIGGIDEEVAEDYQNTKERYDFLSSQLHDLEAAVADLKTMIADLSEVMKKKRAVAFKKIRKEFDRYFKLLFSGGRADLVEVYGDPEPEPDETPPEPPLERGGGGYSPSFQGGDGRGGLVKEGMEGEVSPKARSKKEKVLTGIELIANPPGKKIKHLSALSGGERTLTSIALICAILYNNPSPFVVLDEVEAALDEPNTAKFVRIMTELSLQSQFIIITHNRVTMHIADALYGVVMGTDGVSKLLSVKMEDVPQYEEKEVVAVDKSR